MDWKQYLLALLTIQIVWIVPAFIVLILQGELFLNPAAIAGMDWHLALNSAVSFLTSTNLQHYSGETGATSWIFFI
jgi:K+-transporting ATPase ATPase A chain